MIALECNIFWYTEDQKKISDLGKEVEDPIESSDLKPHTFYKISFIRPYKNYCEIGSNGEIYVVNESYETIKSRIEKNVMFIYS